MKIGALLAGVVAVLGVAEGRAKARLGATRRRTNHEGGHYFYSDGNDEDSRLAPVEPNIINAQNVEKSVNRFEEFLHSVMHAAITEKAPAAAHKDTKSAEPAKKPAEPAKSDGAEKGGADAGGADAGGAEGAEGGEAGAEGGEAAAEEEPEIAAPVVQEHNEIVLTGMKDGVVNKQSINIADSGGEGYELDVHRPDTGGLLPYPGVDYLGAGYDLFYGNPHGDPDTQVDPGFKAPVLNLLYSDSELTRDQAFLLPRGAMAFPVDTCYKTASSISMNTQEEYSHSLSRDCSVGISGGSGSVSGSFGFSYGKKDQTANVVNKHAERYVYVDYCLQYHVGFTSLDTSIFVPTDQFAKDMAALPLVADKSEITDDIVKPWHNFFHTYGTHFLSDVYLGGKTLLQITIDEETADALRESGESVKVTAEATAQGKGSLSAGYGQDTNDRHQHGVGTVKADIKSFIFGGLPPTVELNNPAAFGLWAATVHDFPMPVKYQVLPLSLIPGVDPVAYELMQTHYGTHGYLGEGDIVLDSTPKKSFSPGASNIMMPGDTLEQGAFKEIGDVKLIMQEDGNLVIYYKPTGKALWASNSWYPEDQRVGVTYQCTYQKDGNLVIYASGSGNTWPTWSSMTADVYCTSLFAGRAELNPNGQLEIYEADTGLLWESGSKRPCKKGADGFCPAVSKYFGGGIRNDPLCAS